MSDVKVNGAYEHQLRPLRTIVVCFDGTNGQYNSTNTNVVKLFGLLRKDCPDQQAVYYQPGIGTYFAPGVVSPLFSQIASILDQAVAWYLDAHVMSGYRFLMDNYRAGDKICIFGFSRGAYTARALAGMLEKVGLLSKGNIQQVNFAYKLYKRTDEAGIRLAAGLKRTFAQDVRIDFLGVWDTVQSTGVLVSRTLPFVSSNTSIRVFRHALSLDERRARFRPNLYQWTTPEPEDRGGNSGNVAARAYSTVASFFGRLFKRKNPKDQSHQVGTGTSTDATGRDGHGGEAVSRGTQPAELFVVEELPTTTDVLEVWFSGCHSDVGGGNVEDDVKVSLAQIPLHWMVEHVMQSECGIVFDSEGLARIGFTSPPQSPATPGQSPTSPTDPTVDDGTSAEADAIAPLFDYLKIEKLWWILEILPVSNVWQDAKGVWHKQFFINFGRGRFIPYRKPKFHHTVKERMDCQSLKYKPQATYDGDVVWV